MRGGNQAKGKGSMLIELHRSGVWLSYHWMKSNPNNGIFWFDGFNPDGWLQLSTRGSQHDGGTAS